MLDLPARHPHFVGRQSELARLERALGSLPLLALEGRAGSGKTALALELAERRKQLHPEQPLLWIRARGGWTVESLLLELGRHWSCLAAAAPPDLPLEERLLLWARELNAGGAILVVDDFHLLGDGAVLLLVMREYLRQGRLLLTTRQAVALDALARVDSAIVRIEALEPGEARQLLRQLLDQHDLGGWLETSHFSALLAAGRGQPLLLKLLVSLLLQNRRATLEDVAGFQDEIYTELVEQLERQLDPSEREALRILALFRRPVPAGALGEAGTRLPRLQQRLLVERAAGGTWTTHDVFRDVYEATLDQAESRRLHARCAHYYEDLSGDPVMAREAIHHLVLADRRRRARELLLQNATPLYQGAQYDFLLAQTAQLSDCQEPEATALRILRAEVLAMVGQSEAAVKLFLEAERRGQAGQAIRAMNSRCHLLLEKGELEQAQLIATRALAMLEEMSGRRPGRVKALNALALAQARRGQAAGALQTARQALSIAAEIEDPKGACYAHYARALAYRHGSDWEDAIAAAGQAREQARLAGETRLGFLAAAVEVLALFELEPLSERGHALARERYEASRLYPDPLSQAMAGLGMALSRGAEDRWAEAITLLETALGRAAQHGGWVFLTQLHLTLGVAYQQAAQTSSARVQMETGLKLARAADAFPFTAELELRLGLLEGRSDVSELRFERASALGLRGLAARLRLALAAGERVRGHDRAARECLLGINVAVLDGHEREFWGFLRTLLDGGEARPTGGPWEGLARALLGAQSLSYRLTTLEGARLIGAQELARLRESPGAFDLYLDLPGQLARERERGEVPLLRRKVLTRMLMALLRAQGPLTQEELYLAVWGPPYDPESGGPQVRKNMSSLRDLLEPDRVAPRYLLVQEGAFARKGGYHWAPERTFCLIEEAPTA